MLIVIRIYIIKKDNMYITRKHSYKDKKKEIKKQQTVFEDRKRSLGKRSEHRKRDV